jgi:hypothetical protein
MNARLFGGCQCGTLPHIAAPPKPFRVQLRRAKGWRLPPLTKVVARPSEWGNPWRVGDRITLRYPHPGRKERAAGVEYVRELVISAELAVALYRIAFTPDADEIRAEFAGLNLACWCPLDQPCHADVLLEIANSAASREARTP